MLNKLCIGTAVALGLLAEANGVFMLVSPVDWYLAVPGVTDTGPFNQHFIRDIGLIFLFVGAAFLIGAARPQLRVVAWAAPTLWLGGHALFHYWEVAVGICGPEVLLRDFPAVTLPAVLGAILTLWALDNARSTHPDPGGGIPMTPRMNIFQVAPAGTKAMMAFDASIAGSGLERGVAELVRLRASQINGCAFCIHMHVQDAVKHGESEMRIHMLDAWRESPLFTDRERAALAWTESLTKVAETRAPDADYELVKSQFNETEIAYLTLLIGAINVWNRVQIGLRAVHKVDAPAANAA